MRVSLLNTVEGSGTASSFGFPTLNVKLVPLPCGVYLADSDLGRCIVFRCRTVSEVHVIGKTIDRRPKTIRLRNFRCLPDVPEGGLMEALNKGLSGVSPRDLKPEDLHG